jgi:hypothetical protein
MDQRLEQILGHLKAFALTRPVMYGAPAVAMVGVLAGLAMRTGPLDGPYTPEMEMAGGSSYQAEAEPISWPAGKVPDYVVGTDFLQATQPQPIQVATYQEASYEPPPMPDVPPYVPAQHGPATPPPSPDGPHWASERGDILDVSLPEDRPQRAIPAVMADAAATGMTTR